MNRERPLLDDLVMALRFFSRLPTGSSAHLVPDLWRIAPVLPVASLLMGIAPAFLILPTALGLPPYFAATLAVAAMVIVNGGMMEDALADAADGLFGGGTPARRLEIFRDSRHGTFGVAALCLLLLLRVTAIGSVAAVDPIAAAALWLTANILGRSGGLWLAVALPPARSDGAAATAGTLSVSRFAIGAAMAAALGAIALALVSGFATVLVAAAAIALVTLGWTAVCRRLVGGQTGDLIGAAGALGEIAALVALLFFV